MFSSFFFFYFFIVCFACLLMPSLTETIYCTPSTCQALTKCWEYSGQENKHDHCPQEAYGLVFIVELNF